MAWTRGTRPKQLSETVFHAWGKFLSLYQTSQTSSEMRHICEYLSTSARLVKAVGPGEAQNHLAAGFPVPSPNMRISSPL
jgi:hypothetical protein